MGVGDTYKRHKDAKLVALGGWAQGSLMDTCARGFVCIAERPASQSPPRDGHGVAWTWCPGQRGYVLFLSPVCTEVLLLSSLFLHYMVEAFGWCALGAGLLVTHSSGNLQAPLEH